ncbi:MAG: hypothetical protein J7K72_00265 [Candidatus Aenigmarchaeota archaeon]|nr:hypothetical protein [Candidatus Aenigmarchaeota archaeon]
MVSIWVLNEKGHEELIMSKSEAVVYLKEQIASGKWVFVDGVFQPKPENIGKHLRL